MNTITLKLALVAILAGSGVALALAEGQAGGPVITNSIDMKLVKIPAGEFVMGSGESLESLAKAFPAYEPRRFAVLDDDPPHRVRITKPFFMGVHEVTIGQFKRFLAETGYRTEPERDGTGGWGYNPETQEIEGRNPKYSWRNPGFPQADDHPVVNITWNDAVEFCRWLSKKEGKTYRLPTEAEWEYACRAGTTTRYNCGDDPESLTKSANTFDADSRPLYEAWSRFALKSSDGFKYTAPVGSFRPNAFGLYDMHGNVWEWCSDFYGDDYYRNKSPLDDPKGPPSGRRHSRRGGCWHSFALYVRSNYRNYNTPQSRYANLGLRVVLEDVQ
jgi:formylglycine-generating enzyme required for sulfatase activity